jgi:hypothetical protein
MRETIFRHAGLTNAAIGHPTVAKRILFLGWRARSRDLPNEFGYQLALAFFGGLQHVELALRQMPQTPQTLGIAQVSDTAEQYEANIRRVFGDQGDLFR